MFVEDELGLCVMLTFIGFFLVEFRNLKKFLQNVASYNSFQTIKSDFCSFIVYLGS